MDETLKGVAEFHEAFGIAISPNPNMPLLSEAQKTEAGAIAQRMEDLAQLCHDAAEASKGTHGNTAFLRLQLIQEELSELARGLEHENIYEALDALTDIQYVLDGSYLSLGLHPLKLPAHREVQRSNMTKLGADGKPIINEAGRVVKGPNFDPPRLKELMYSWAYGGNVQKEQPK